MTTCTRCGKVIRWDVDAGGYVAEDDDDPTCEHVPPVGRHRLGS